MSLRPLQPGSRIGIVAPASAPLDPASLRIGLGELRRRGLEPVFEDEDLEPLGYLAGTDEERAAAFNRMIERDDIDVIMCVRGGFGSLRILDRINYASATIHPKVLVGYSDVTALQLALHGRSGWKGLSGPMVAVDWVDPDPRTEELFWKLARGGTGRIEAPDGEELTALKQGACDAVLLGGNLSVLTALIGTSFLPDLEGAILFVEDVDEAPYRVDGCLARLRLAGILDSLGGLVFGSFSGWQPKDDRPTLTYDDVFRQYAEYVNGPVVTGLIYGHIRRKTTIPLGVRAYLSAAAPGASLEILESVIGSTP